MPRDDGASLEALISPRYEPFHGAKMRYQQARNYYVSKKKAEDKPIELSPPPEAKKPMKPKIIEYVEPEKDYLRENMANLKSKKKGK
mmetsp:Transcript_22412/g.25773  ORF Transcript_22412/g.25773 Transcript_22412/m.25773 type:complete len:87 (+) Transcript_22412:1197-1457(+)